MPYARSSEDKLDACISLEFDATYTPGGGYFVTNGTHFNVTDFTINGTVNITSYGNASGGANVSHWPPGDVTIWG